MSKHHFFDGAMEPGGPRRVNPEPPAEDTCPDCPHSLLIHEKGRCTYSVKTDRGGRISCECGRPAAA